MNSRIRVSLAFGKLPDSSFLIFARAVHTNLYPMPEFPSPPVAAADLDSSILAFADAKSAQTSGGRSATVLKNSRREALEQLMKRLAFYVQENCDNNLVAVLDSGFDTVSENRSRTQLEKPSLLKIVSGKSGQAMVTISRESNSRGFEIVAAEVDEMGKQGEFRPAVTRTSSMNIPIDALPPGKMIAFKGRAIGGVTDYSDWSDVVMFRVG